MMMSNTNAIDCDDGHQFPDQKDVRFVLPEVNIELCNAELA
jgi:hypothetical protein